MSAALRKQVAEKKAKLRELQETHRRTEDLVFRLLNQPSPYMIDMNKLAAARKEVSKLRHILAVRNKAQLVGAFNELADKRQREIARREKQVAELQGEKDELERRLKELTAQDPSGNGNPMDIVKLTLSDFSTGVHDLRAELLKMRGEIEDRMKQTKQQIREALQRAYDEGMKRIKEHDNKIRALQKKKANLEADQKDLAASAAELAESKAGVKKPVTIDEDPEAVRKQREQMVKRVREILKQSQQRLLKCRVEKEFVLKLNLAIDNLNVAIDRVVGKIERMVHIIKVKQQFEDEKVMAKNRLQAKVNFGLLLRIARKCNQVQTVMKKMMPQFKAEAEKIQAQAEKEEKDRTAIVGDTGLTISDLRKEIIRLEREIYNVNFNGEREIEANENERKRLTDLAQKEHERLQKVNG